MKLPKLLTVALTSLLFSASQISVAATDGIVGPTSTGEITIRLVISQGIQIENLKDIDVTTTNYGSEDLEIIKQFCVRGSVGDLYTLTAFSNTPTQDEFNLVGDNNSRLPFELYYRADMSAEGFDRMAPQVFSKKYTVNSSGLNCNGQDNSELKMVIPYTVLNSAKYDLYNGFLNLTVAVD